jgi:hypothetical protein
MEIYMKEVDKKVTALIQLMENKGMELHQIKEFDESLKRLGLTDATTKPSYTYPLVDTIGRNTYSLLNKK